MSISLDQFKAQPRDFKGLFNNVLSKTFTIQTYLLLLLVPHATIILFVKKVKTPLRASSFHCTLSYVVFL